MKQYRFKAFVALCGVALAVVAGVSASASAATRDADARKAERFLTVTLHGHSVGYAPRANTRGRTTIVVHNATAGAESFVLARHVGGLLSLPRFAGIPFVPADEVVARLHRIPAGKQQRVAVTLAPGSYLLVATANASGAILADAVMSFRVL